MNNNWSNAGSIKNKLDNQDCMIELNTINDKIIMIEDNDCEVLDTKYINDKNNKIYWRTLWSFLDIDSIEKITNYYYKDFMKNNILQIKPYIRFGSYNWSAIDIVEDIYDCKISYTESNFVRANKRKIRDKEEWIMVEYETKDSMNDNKIKQSFKNRKKKISNSNYGCRFLKSNGENCSKSANDLIKIDKEYYTELLKENINVCGIHKNQYNRLSDKKKKDKIEEVFGSIGMIMKNGVMCNC
jgi:hypothetical protein